MKKLLITDLDNTLYDWVSFFAPSFKAMLKCIEEITGIDEEVLLDEFKEVHRAYGNTEQPFAALQLPSVQHKFGTSDRTKLHGLLDEAFHAFNKKRKETLKLYPKVHEGLRALHAEGVRIVGHTEAIVSNSFWRIERLDVSKYFSRLYSLEGEIEDHPKKSQNRMKAPTEDFLVIVPRIERKPNPALLHDICKREGVLPSEAIYIGDSLTRDISMANEAGIDSIWAEYGTKYDPELWGLLVKVTHWTEEDVQRETRLKERYRDATPTYIAEDFGEAIEIVLRH